jgi:glycerol-3-phosphate acyltransferase PlsX
MRIAVDAMGGDNAPAALVAGAVAAARDFRVAVLLCGDQRALERELALQTTGGLDIEVRHTRETIAMDAAPTTALHQPESSLHACLEAVREGDAAAAVYAGNTGAGMILGLKLLGRIPGVERPAIGVLLPRPGGQTLLLDAGANVDTRPLHLAQFAVMGDAYIRSVRGVAAPRIGLLSNGVEEGKGDARVRQTRPLLAHLPIHFIGQVEAVDLCSDRADVVVCDGFAGNVALKGLEGLGKLVGAELGTAFRNGLRGRLAWLLLRPTIDSLRKSIDPRETGGAPLLGLRGTVIKAHGSSDARAVRNAIGLAMRLTERDVPGEVERGIERVANLGEPTGDKSTPGRTRALWRSLKDRLRVDPVDQPETAPPSVAKEEKENE